MMMSRVIVLAVVLICAACRPDAPSRGDHPATLVGTWERQHADGTWGDALEFLPDGKVAGTASHPVPSSAYWSVHHDTPGGETLCVGDDRNASCRPFSLTNETLTLRGGPSPPTTFRRVH
jgi:hypothetical protein